MDNCPECVPDVAVLRNCMDKKDCKYMLMPENRKKLVLSLFKFDISDDRKSDIIDIIYQLGMAEGIRLLRNNIERG
jgi:hypothetical protein